MQELNEKLNKINNIKGQIKDSIVNKKGAITDQTPFEDYPKAIDELPSGEGGEKIFAYYNGSDIEAGKKILLTRTNNAIATDEGFMNGNIPLLISDGLAYCGDSSSSSTIKKVRNIIDGTISDEYVSIVNQGYWASPALLVYGKETGSSASKSIGFTWVHSMAGGKSMLQTYSATDRLSTSFYIYAYTLLTDNILQCGGYKQNSTGAGSNGSYRLSCTENYVVWRDRYVVKAGEGLDTKGNLVSYSKDIGDNGGCFCFERKNEGGRYLYSICNYGATWYFKKYDHETKTVLDSRNGDIDVPYYDFSINSNGYGSRGVYVQTKDYKYLLGAEFYLQLDARQSLKDEPTGIVAKQYPEAITSVLGDRFIGAIQTFYDNTFALTLNDGSTLMCKYDEEGAIGLLDNDYLQQTCSVEEIAPYIKPDDTNIYYRHFSSDKAYWFTSITRNYNTSSSFIGSEAYPYNASELVNSYLAIDYSKERFNSTLLTGFMTGETKKDDNGLTMIEVKTVTS